MLFRDDSMDYKVNDHAVDNPIQHCGSRYFVTRFMNMSDEVNLPIRRNVVLGQAEGEQMMKGSTKWQWSST